MARTATKTKAAKAAAVQPKALPANQEPRDARPAVAAMDQEIDAMETRRAILETDLLALKPQLEAARLARDAWISILENRPATPVKQEITPNPATVFRMHGAQGAAAAAAPAGARATAKASSGKASPKPAAKSGIPVLDSRECIPYKSRSGVQAKATAPARPAGQTYGAWAGNFVQAGGPDPRKEAAGSNLAIFCEARWARAQKPSGAAKDWEELGQAKPPAKAGPTPPRLVDGDARADKLDHGSMMELAALNGRIPGGDVAGSVAFDSKRWAVTGCGEDEDPDYTRFYCQELLAPTPGQPYDTPVERRAKTRRGVPIDLTGMRAVLHPELADVVFGPDVVAVRMFNFDKGRPKST